MNVKTYENIVDLLRKEYPALSLDSVVDNIEEAVEKFGVKVKYSDMSHIQSDEEISGYVHVVDNKPEIAHELGHILLHWKWLPREKWIYGRELPKGLVEVSYRKENYLTEEENLRERQADNFAAEFLAPLKDVVAFLKKFDNPDREVSISRIAEKFRISKPAAFYRWKEAKEVVNEQ